MPGSHLLFNSGVKEGRRRHGVGFLMNKQIVKSVLEFKPISERLALMKLRDEYVTTIVQCYFPTIEGSDEDVDKLYDSIQGSLISAQKGTI